MKNKTVTLAITLACFALAGPSVQAQDASGTAAAIRALAALDGADYLAERHVLLGSELAVAELAALQTTATWASPEWPVAAAAAALEVRLANPGLARIDQLRGLDPGHYRLRRVPRPEVGRSSLVSAMTSDRPQVAALVIETHAFLREAYSSGPANRTHAMILEERRALSEGLLAALERIADPRGLELVREVAADEDAVTADRVLAIRALGAMVGRRIAADPTTTEPELLAEVAGYGARSGSRLRHAAAQGLAKIPTAEALVALQTQFTGETDAEVRATILTSIGLYAAPMVWHAYGDALAERADLRRAAAATLVAEAFAASEPGAEREAARGAVMLARHAAALEALDPRVAAEAELIDALRIKLTRKSTRKR